MLSLIIINYITEPAKTGMGLVRERLILFGFIEVKILL